MNIFHLNHSIYLGYSMNDTIGLLIALLIGTVILPAITVLMTWEMCNLRNRRLVLKILYTCIAVIAGYAMAFFILGATK